MKNPMPAMPTAGRREDTMRMVRDLLATAFNARLAEIESAALQQLGHPPSDEEAAEIMKNAKAQAWSEREAITKQGKAMAEQAEKIYRAHGAAIRRRRRLKFAFILILALLAGCCAFYFFGHHAHAGKPKKPAVVEKEPATTDPPATTSKPTPPPETSKKKILQCPEGQSTIHSDSGDKCGCPDGQVYDTKKKTCYTPE